MPPWLRKLALTAHVTFSLSWIGAVAAFLLLALAGLTSTDEQMVRSAYLSMDLIGWRLIVPLCFAALLTGVLQGLATPWGLFRHYWVLLKLATTALLTLLLMVHMQPTRRLAAVASQSAVPGNALHALQVQLAVDAAAALLALIAVATLAIYKPRGVTPYGARRLALKAPGEQNSAVGMPLWVKLFLLIGILSLIAVRTLSGAGAHHGAGDEAQCFDRHVVAGRPARRARDLDLALHAGTVVAGPQAGEVDRARVGKAPDEFAVLPAHRGCLRRHALARRPPTNPLGIQSCDRGGASR